MRERSAAVFVLCAALCACTVWRDRPAKSVSDATGGEGLVRAFWREVKDKRWADVEKHLASNYVEVTASGTRDRTATLEYLEQLKLEDYSLGDFETELNGDTFVVTYTLILRGRSTGQIPPEGAQRILTVWQQQKGGWVEIAQSKAGPEGKR
jgi:hypothetical protein